MRSERRSGVQVAGVAIAVLLGAVAGCGDAFDGEDDCMETRTCPKPDDGGGAGGAGTTAAGGGDSSGADTEGSEGPHAGSGGGEIPAECAVPADCDNADAADGEETCFNGKCAPGNPPPKVVSVTPEDEAVGVEPDGSIVIELNEPLDAATVTSESVRILDGDDAVAGELSYAGNQITFVPEKPLALLVPYTVSVSSDVTDVAGAALAKPFSSTFKVRDGSWEVQTVVAGGVNEVAPTIQLTDEGDALLAWIGTGWGTCPTTALWFNRGSALSAPKTMSYRGDQYCRGVHAAVSRNGLALVSWYEEYTEGSTTATTEFRNGTWGQTTARGRRYDGFGAVAVSEDGTMHYLSPSGDVQVWQTTPAGVWSTEGQVLAPRESKGDLRVAVAANGDAVAVWRDDESDGRQSVYAARFSSATATWGSAAAIPGSLVIPTPDSTRGQPQVAYDDANVPVIVWRRGAQLVATHYDVLQAVWSGPQLISGQVTGLSDVPDYPEPPALVFDGGGFVAAFTVKNGVDYDNYVVRYDREDEAWQEPELVSTAAARGSARMPRLTADAHGNLLLVWAKGKSAGVYELVARRFDASTDTWSEPVSIPGATMKNTELEQGLGNFALGGNASGLAALSFSDADSVAKNPTRLQLASFY